MTNHADGDEIKFVGHAQKKRKQAEHAALHENAVAQAPPPALSSKGERIDYGEGSAVPVVITPPANFACGSGGGLSRHPPPDHHTRPKPLASHQVRALPK